jgi:hypothetical protein
VPQYKSLDVWLGSRPLVHVSYPTLVNIQGVWDHASPVPCALPFPRYPGCTAPFRQCLISAPRVYCLLSHYPFFTLLFQVGGWVGAKVSTNSSGVPGWILPNCWMATVSSSHSAFFQHASVYLPAWDTFCAITSL